VSTLIGGNRAQAYVNRGALDRQVRHLAQWSAILSALAAIVAIGGLIWYAHLPRLMPVPVAQNQDGSYSLYAIPTNGNDAGNRYLLTTWLTSWQSGCNDPNTMCAKQTAALVDGDHFPEVAKTVHDFNQKVADDGQKVSPKLTFVRGSGTEYSIEWDESIDTGGSHAVHQMRASISVAFELAKALLETDPVTNPFGLVIRDLRVSETGVK
jgi:type IV secretory pathway TrbF-like protein